MSAQRSDALLAWVRLLRAHAAMTRQFNAQLQRDHGLTVSDFEALSRLASAPEGMRRVDLAESLRLTPSGVTRLLDGLQAAGLVCKAACATDARVTYARVTDAGRERLSEASATHTEALAELFAERFSAKEAGELSELLGRLPGAGDESVACAAPDRLPGEEA